MRKATISPPAALMCAVGLLAATTVVRVSGTGQAPQPTSQQIDFFETKIRPILVNSCFDCHTFDEKGGLRLDSREAMLKGGDSGPAIVAGEAEASLLIKAVRHVQGVSKMPRSAPKLTDAEIAALAEWIGMGAPWPATPRRRVGDKLVLANTPGGITMKAISSSSLMSYAVALARKPATEYSTPTSICFDLCGFSSSPVNAKPKFSSTFGTRNARPVLTCADHAEDNC